MRPIAVCLIIYAGFGLASGFLFFQLQDFADSAWFGLFAWVTAIATTVLPRRRNLGIALLVVSTLVTLIIGYWLFVPWVLAGPL